MGHPAAPIGVFDSGVGGLSILRAVRAALPQESLCYVADSGHVPYGVRSTDYLQRRVLTLGQFFQDQGAKALVIACNTATVAAAPYLRQRVPYPVIAVEPGVKPAVAQTTTGVVGVLATAATLNSAQFHQLTQRFGSMVTILAQPCPRLVQQVEAGDLHSPYTRRCLEEYIGPLVAAGADTLVLGCTHFPLLRPTLDQVAGPGVAIVETGSAVTRQLVRVLTDQQLLRPGRGLGDTAFWTSGPAQPTADLIATLWGQPVALEVLPMVYR